jgi:hypothetical protein
MYIFIIRELCFGFLIVFDVIFVLPPAYGSLSFILKKEHYPMCIFSYAKNIHLINSSIFTI